MKEDQLDALAEITADEVIKATEGKDPLIQLMAHIQIVAIGNICTKYASTIKLMPNLLRAIANALDLLISEHDKDKK